REREQTWARRATGRTHLQLGYGGLRGGASLRPPRLRGRRHLRPVRSADEGGCHNQPAAARRCDGLHSFSRQTFNRAFAKRKRAPPERTVEFDAEHRKVVTRLRVVVCGPVCADISNRIAGVGKALYSSCCSAHRLVA